MLAACCCRESEDANQLIFQQPVSSDVVPVAYRAGPPVTVMQQPLLPDGFAEGAAQGPVPDPNAGTQSARSLTPEEKEQEKARLQQLVNSFAKKAVKGCPCVYLKEGTGKRSSTQYRINKSLEHLVIENPKDPSQADVMCPIAGIQDIYSVSEDGEACFPQDVLQTLIPEEKELLLMVVYRSGQKQFRFCLLEASPNSRDVFLECLRILCIYAQSDKGGQ